MVNLLNKFRNPYTFSHPTPYDQTLPRDTIWEVFDYLAESDLMNMRMTSKHWKDTATEYLKEKRGLKIEKREVIIKITEEIEEKPKRQACKYKCGWKAKSEASCCISITFFALGFTSIILIYFVPQEFWIELFVGIGVLMLVAVVLWCYAEMSAAQ